MSEICLIRIIKSFTPQAENYPPIEVLNLDEIRNLNDYEIKNIRKVLEYLPTEFEKELNQCRK